MTENKGPVFCCKLQSGLELAPERRKIIRARALAWEEGMKEAGSGWYPAIRQPKALPAVHWSRK